MLDRYVYGEVERISPEAPVPILAIEREIAIPGGAGNVVRNLTALGAAVAFISGSRLVPQAVQCGDHLRRVQVV